jgi:hypothetical protein
MSGIYLYGILPIEAELTGEGLGEIQGLDKQTIHLKQVDQFQVLYSDAQQARYLASRRNLLGHERVLETVMEAGCRNLLPLRFGLTVADWDMVESQLLTPYGTQMRSLFSKLEGTREVSVKVFWEPEAELQQMMLENTALATERDRMVGQNLNMDQIIRIGQSIEAAASARREDLLAEFRSTLTPLSIEQVENDTLTEDMIYNSAFLIPWDHEAKFAEAVESIDAQYPDRFKIRYNNFTAPYNFAQLN